MAAIFLKLFNMSITACWIVLAVVVFRLLFKKAPKWINCLLWGIVGLRLVLPFSLKSMFSLVPSVQTVTPNPDSYGVPFEINTGITIVNTNINEYLDSHYYEGITRPANNFSNILDICGQVWVIGVIALLVYGLISYILLAKRVAPSLNKEGNVYLCDEIDSPFILGIVRPKIYLPSHISEEQAAYVIEHEKAHLKRRDHWWKPLGFLLLCIYWFNPVMWLAYILLCRDIEQACDEKVIKDMGVDYKKGYSHALVACSVKRFAVSACPLAFGEVGVKERIKSVLNYKKPAFWIIIIALLAGVAVALCFLTDPKDKDDGGSDIIIESGISNVVSGTSCNDVDFDFVSGSVKGSDSYIAVKWTNNSSEDLCFGREFTVYKDGEEFDPAVPFTWTLELSMVMPGFTYSESYDLSHYSLPKGEYRIEKLFYLESDKETEYTAYIEFTVDEDVRTRVVYRTIEQYEPIEAVYYSSVISALKLCPTILVEEGAASIVEEGREKYSYVKTYLGILQEIDLLKSKVTEKINKSMDMEGIAAELEKNNLKTYYVESPDTEYCYYLFEQKNGECYVAMGKINDIITCISKARSTLIYTTKSSEYIMDVSVSLSQIREKYPEVFELSTKRGLQIFVSSFAEGNYRFSITDGANRTKNIIELTALPSFSADEMKAILSTYDISSSDIAVIPYQNMYSSYLWFDKENDVEMLRQMLGLE